MFVFDIIALMILKEGLAPGKRPKRRAPIHTRQPSRYERRREAIREHREELNRIREENRQNNKWSIGDYIDD